MLTIRRRGRYFHARGTVRVGGETRVVAEHSTGCTKREDAEAYRNRLETEIRGGLLGNHADKSRSLTVADAGLRYVGRPGGVKTYDLWRVGEINRVCGDIAISQSAEAWAKFRKERCAGLSPATVERFRAIFQAMLNYLAAEDGFEAPKIRRLDKVSNKRIRFLTREQQERLLDGYTQHVRPIAVTLCFQGLRIGEALRLDWTDLSWQPGSLFVRETKSGESRTVTLHDRVRKELHRLWVSVGSPQEGRIFLNRFGRPYADPRQYTLPGGSPIRRAHGTACERARIEDFHIHDWRHHWASWCVMSGIDLETIRQEGGWKSLRMVERYATVSAAHRRRVMRRLK